nr:uncharacterized protein LOC117979689 [Pan paniscus]
MSKNNSQNAEISLFEVCKPLFSSLLRGRRAIKNSEGNHLEIRARKDDFKSPEKGILRQLKSCDATPYPRPHQPFTFSPTPTPSVRVAWWRKEDVWEGGVCGSATRPLNGWEKDWGPRKSFPGSPPPAQTPAADTKPERGGRELPTGLPAPGEVEGDGSPGNTLPTPRPAPVLGTIRPERREERAGEDPTWSSDNQGLCPSG